MTGDIDNNPHNRAQRQWQALSPLRLGLGLAAGPAILTLLYAAMFLMLGNPVLQYTGITAIVSQSWTLLAGFIYFVVIVQRRGFVTRFECLLFAMASALPIPFLIRIAGIALLFGAWPPFEYTFVIFNLALMALYGILSGWLLWRIAIRPAEVPLHEVAKVS